MCWGPWHTLARNHRNSTAKHWILYLSDEDRCSPDRQLNHQWKWNILLMVFCVCVCTVLLSETVTFTQCVVSLPNECQWQYRNLFLAHLRPLGYCIRTHRSSRVISFQHCFGTDCTHNHILNNIYYQLLAIYFRFISQSLCLCVLIFFSINAIEKLINICCVFVCVLILAAS